MKCPYSRHFDELEEIEFKGEKDMAVKKGSSKSAGKSAPKTATRRRRSGDDLNLSPSEEKLLDNLWDTMGKKLTKKKTVKGASKGGKRK